MLQLSPRHWSRETRLLTVTIVLSTSVLLLLARYRFPAEQPLELPTQPLQRLAARAAFDDLSTVVARATERIRPSIVVVRAGDPEAGPPRSLSVEDVLRTGLTEPSHRFVLAYRFRTDLALAMAPASSLHGGTDGGMSVRARDDLRGITILQTPPAPEGWQALAAASATAPQYLLAAEPTPGGVTVRPLFGGSTDPYTSAPWDQPLLALGHDVRAAHGALVFSLEGAFVGAVVRVNGLHAVVPAEALLRAAARLVSTPMRPAATLGVRLQALDRALAAATRASSGVVVSDVHPDGPAAGLLQPGDVVTAIGSRPARSPEQALLAIAALDVGEPTEIRMWRRGSSTALSITPAPIRDPAAPAVPDQLGLVMRRGPNGSVVTSVDRPSVGAQAGVREGDIIISLDGSRSPAPAAVQAAYEALQPGAHLLLGLEREGSPLMVAVARP